MRAMILAAGRGERMGALTAKTPKPLLKVAGRYLIEHVIHRLKSAGIDEIVINVSYLAQQIKTALGYGDRYGVTLAYSEETERLETGGGIYRALPLLGDAPFLVVSADIMTDFSFAHLPKSPHSLAHLVLVDNPAFHPQGDFGLETGIIKMQARPRLTFANIGVYRPELFSSCHETYFPLNQLLYPAIRRCQITGEYFQGTWFNIGLPEEFIKVNHQLGPWHR
jgi:MurNAc alpha-1-phosphate uridylyltransferase